MNSIKHTLGLSVAALIFSTSLYADNSSDIAELKRQIAELMKKSQEQTQQTQALIDETSDLKNGFNYTTVDTTKSHAGLGAAASKVYYSKSPLSIGGYGEMYYSYTANEGTDNSSKTSIKRFIPYIGYKFSDSIILNTEIEFEEGGANNGSGETVVEFMYIDFLLNKHANIRVGNMLMPMGLINKRHEPTLFTTVQRPLTSRYLIPSTWSETGIMAYGNISNDFSYTVAGVTALQVTDNGNKWIRNGRGGTADVNNPGLGVAMRLDYRGVNGMLLGASTYVDSDVTMWDVHLDYNIDAFRIYGTYSQTNRSGATVGQVDRASGGFINLGYDLLSLTTSKYRLPVFVQFESVSPQDRVVGSLNGGSIDVTTVGVNFFPHEQVVLKLDYAMASDNSNPGSSSIDSNTASVSVGFIF